MPRTRDKKRIRAAITAGTTAISAAVEIATGGLGIATGIVQGSTLVFDALWNRQQKRGARMLRSAFDAPDEQFADVIRAKLENEDVRDALLEAMRSALESLSDEVIPALGALIREYDKQKRRPDWFFRACCRLLEDLSPEEYASFAALMRVIANSRATDEHSVQVQAIEGHQEWSRAAEGAPASGPFVIVTASGLNPGAGFAATGCDPAHMKRLIHLFDREDLGRRETGSRGHPVYLAIEVAAVRSVARILPER